jgi:hypothetical protein
VPGGQGTGVVGAEDPFLVGQQRGGQAQRPGRVPALDNPRPVARLLDSLREAGAQQQATALAERLRGQACSSSSVSKKAAKIGSGSAGRLTAAQPGHGDGKIWTDVAGLSDK